MSITVVNKPVTPLANTANYSVPEANADLVVKDKKILKNKQLLQDMLERMMIVRKFEERVFQLFAQGLVSGISNSVTTAIVGSLLCVAYAATKTKAGSLTKE